MQERTKPALRIELRQGVGKNQGKVQEGTKEEARTCIEVAE
jgi:hypothetical protein